MITRATSALKLPYKHTISDLPTHVWYLPSVGWNPATNQQKPAAQSQVPLILCHRVKKCKIRVSWVLSQIRRVISELTWHLKKPLRCRRWAMVIVSIFHWMREISTSVETVKWVNRLSHLNLSRNYDKWSKQFYIKPHRRARGSFNRIRQMAPMCTPL